MANIISERNNTSARRGQALLLLPGALLLSSSLTVINPTTANATPQFEQRGSHGAQRIVKPSDRPAPQATPLVQESVPAKPSKAQAPVRPTPRQSPILFRQGSHGGFRIVRQKGVGGQQRGGAYKGFPKLEQRGSHGGYRIR